MSSQAHTWLGRLMKELISECITVLLLVTASGGFRKASLSFPLGQKGAWAVEMEPLLVTSTWLQACDWAWGSSWLRGAQLVLTQ